MDFLLHQYAVDANFYWRCIPSSLQKTTPAGAGVDNRA
jgi:hypothetical protein